MKMLSWFFSNNTDTSSPASAPSQRNPFRGGGDSPLSIIKYGCYRHVCWTVSCGSPGHVRKLNNVVSGFIKWTEVRKCVAQLREWTHSLVSISISLAYHKEEKGSVRTKTKRNMVAVATKASHFWSNEETEFCFKVVEKLNMLSM